MIRSLPAVPLALLLWALPALAQDNSFEGLDLSGDQKKDDKKAAPAKEEAPAAPAAEKSQPDAPKAAAPAVERDVTQEDRVKSVQRKLYMKQ